MLFLQGPFNSHHQTTQATANSQQGRLLPGSKPACFDGTDQRYRAGYRANIPQRLKGRIIFFQVEAQRFEQLP